VFVCNDVIFFIQVLLSPLFKEMDYRSALQDPVPDKKSSSPASRIATVAKGQGTQQRS